METDIKNPQLIGTLWNWRPVAELLPGKAGVSDIDGVIEHNGHFIFKHFNDFWMVGITLI